MITFWAECSHHAQSIKPIYNWMAQQGKDVLFQISSRPPKEGNVVTSSAHVAGAYGKPLNRFIYLNHSLGTHEIYGDYPIARRFKAVMFPGVWWKAKMKNLPRNMVVGWPKSDVLFDGKPVEKRGQTLLYASSYTALNRKAALERARYAKIIIKIARKLGFNVFIKPHPAMIDSNFKLLKALGSKNVRVLPRKPENSMSIFPLVDAMVSETSGILCEFLATGKPAVQLSRSAKHVIPGGVFSSKVENLAKVLSPLKRHPERSKWRHFLLGKVNGKASKRAAWFIEEVFK